MERYRKSVGGDAYLRIEGVNPRDLREGVARRQGERPAFWQVFG